MGLRQSGRMSSRITTSSEAEGTAFSRLGWFSLPLQGFRPHCGARRREATRSQAQRPLDRPQLCREQRHALRQLPAQSEKAQVGPTITALSENARRPAFASCGAVMKPFPLSRPVSSLLIIDVTSLPRDTEGKCRVREDMEKRAAEVYYRWGNCLLALYAPGCLLRAPCTARTPLRAPRATRAPVSTCKSEVVWVIIPADGGSPPLRTATHGPQGRMIDILPVAGPGRARMRIPSGPCRPGDGCRTYTQPRFCT